MYSFDNGELPYHFDNYFFEIPSVHNINLGLILCKNIIYQEWKRLWINLFKLYWSQNLV